MHMASLNVPQELAEKMLPLCHVCQQKEVGRGSNAGPVSSTEGSDRQTTEGVSLPIFFKFLLVLSKANSILNLQFPKNVRTKTTLASTGALSRAPACHAWTNFNFLSDSEVAAFTFPHLTNAKVEV